MIRLLKHGECYVTFVKNDGTLRNMRCTLAEDLIEPYQRKTDREKVKNDQIISVWDLEKHAWRSFHYDSVQHFDKYPGNLL